MWNHSGNKLDPLKQIVKRYICEQYQKHDKFEKSARICQETHFVRSIFSVFYWISRAGHSLNEEGVAAVNHEILQVSKETIHRNHMRDLVDAAGPKRPMPFSRILFVVHSRL